MAEKTISEEQYNEIKLMLEEIRNRISMLEARNVSYGPLPHHPFEIIGPGCRPPELPLFDINFDDLKKDGIILYEDTKIDINIDKGHEKCQD
jgi:hypothetical protein